MAAATTSSSRNAPPKDVGVGGGFAGFGGAVLVVPRSEILWPPTMQRSVRPQLCTIEARASFTPTAFAGPIASPIGCADFLGVPRSCAVEVVIGVRGMHGAAGRVIRRGVVGCGTVRAEVGSPSPSSLDRTRNGRIILYLGDHSEFFLDNFVKSTQGACEKKVKEEPYETNKGI